VSINPIRVLVVDDNEKARDRLIDQLRFEDVEVVGESTLGAAAFTWAEHLNVDLIVVAIEEPVARALRTVETLTVGSRTWPVIGLSSQGDRDTMRKAMLAGVRDYLVSPVSGDDLRRAIVAAHNAEQARRQAAEGGSASRLGTIITVFGIKGGIGKSSLATNVAVGLAQETKQHVVLADLDLQFGDDAVMLDIVPSLTIADAAEGLERMDPQLISGFLSEHPSRLKLLASPPTPDVAQAISGEHVGLVLEALAATNDYVVVDTAAQFDDVSMPALDLATIVVLAVVPEVTCIRRTKAALTLMQEWGYSQDKLKLVVNRTRRRSEVSIAEIQQVLQYPIFAEIPDDRAMQKAISLGTPVAMSGPKTKSGRAIIEMGRTMAGMPAQSRRGGGFSLRKKQKRARPIERWPSSPPASTYHPAPVADATLLSVALAASEASTPVHTSQVPNVTSVPEPTPSLAREHDYWGALLGLSNAKPASPNGHEHADVNHHHPEFVPNGHGVAD
jgi:pilus assembly protein CpaE